MKVHIRKIKPGGIVVSETWPAEALELTTKDPLQFIGPIDIEAQITRTSDKVLAKLKAGSKYASYCSRCLEDVKKDWTATFKLVFDIVDGEEFIHMDEDIRQELILNLPSRILCENDCRGLCVDCGINLNKQACEHQHLVVSDN